MSVGRTNEKASQSHLIGLTSALTGAVPLPAAAEVADGDMSVDGSDVGVLTAAAVLDDAAVADWFTLRLSCATACLPPMKSGWDVLM